VEAETVESIGKAVEALGIVVILLGGFVAFSFYVRAVISRSSGIGAFQELRRNLGRSILLGLEILIAGDIIQTIAISPTFTSVGVLALIVAVRTFLSFTLQLEIEGTLPWRRQHAPEGALPDSARRAPAQVVGTPRGR
jgi:uncharacterized membrane protein